MHKFGTIWFFCTICIFWSPFLHFFGHHLHFLVTICIFWAPFAFFGHHLHFFCHHLHFLGTKWSPGCINSAPKSIRRLCLHRCCFSCRCCQWEGGTRCSHLQARSRLRQADLARRRLQRRRVGGRRAPRRRRRDRCCDRRGQTRKVGARAKPIFGDP